MQEKIDNDDKADAARREKEKLEQEAETIKKMAILNAKMEAEKKEQEEGRAAMQADFDAKMAALQEEVKNKKDDEQARQEALEKEAQMRLEMEF